MVQVVINLKNMEFILSSQISLILILIYSIVLVLVTFNIINNAKANFTDKILAILLVWLIPGIGAIIYIINSCVKLYFNKKAI